MRILFLSVLVLGLTAAPTSVLAQDDFTEHAYGDVFRLSVPGDWDVRQDVKSVRLIALAPLDGPDDPFRENLNVTIQDVPEATSLEAYYDDVFAEIATSIPSFQEVETRNTRIGGVPAKRLVYEYTFNGRPFRVITLRPPGRRPGLLPHGYGARQHVRCLRRDLRADRRDVRARIEPNPLADLGMKVWTYEGVDV